MKVVPKGTVESEGRCKTSSFLPRGVVPSDDFTGELSQSVSLISTDAFFLWHSEDSYGNHVLVVALDLVNEFVWQK